MNRTTVLAIVLAFSAVAASTAVAQEKKVDTRGFMRLKLKHAQSVLEGLATEDYELIGRSAQAMILLSHESNWMVIQSPAYNEHSGDFRRIAAQLQKHAKEKNLDAAALDYVLLTTSCVNCHKYVRDFQSK